MTVIPSAGPGLLARFGADRTSSAIASGAPTFRSRRSPAAERPVHVTFAKNDHVSAVYGDPRAKPGAVRLASSPVGNDDTVGALMARNRGMRSYNLNDQWRGLGGALLTRFDKTGEDYTRTLVNEAAGASDDALDAVPPEERAKRAAELLARQAGALAGVATHAPTAGLKVQTRSGQSVELKISVDAGAAGMKVELKASGAMSTADRAAIGQLADGLDRALEGLGRNDALALDLSGLTNYDHRAIASVDLSASNSQSHQALGTFSLHLGDDRQSIALQGSDGELELNVDTKASLRNAPAEQRNAAIARTLDRMSKAAERGHADAALIQQMKSAFEQLQAPAATADGRGRDGTGGTPGAPAVAAARAAKTARPAPALAAKPLSKTAAHAGVDADVASRLSGLADFDASFGGETARRNRHGTTHEAGHAEYRLSQSTTTKAFANGSRSVAQTVSERLSADFLTAPGDAMLDVRTGDYSATRVRDSSTMTTLIDADADHVTRALRKTDELRLETVTDFQSHHMARRQQWPSQVSSTERIG